MIESLKKLLAKVQGLQGDSNKKKKKKKTKQTWGGLIFAPS